MAFGICISSCRRPINITITMVGNVKSVIFLNNQNLTSAGSGFVNSSEDSDLQKINGLTRLGPQMGLESTMSIISTLIDISRFANISIDDDTLRQVEGIVALFVNLSGCTSFTHFSTSVFLYARDLCDSSVWKCVHDYVKDVVNSLPYDKQSDAFDPTWVKLLKDVQNNWVLVKENKAFKQFSKLLSVFVTLGLCKASSLTFDIAGFKLFDEALFKKHLSAFDLADAIFGTVSYFAEGMYLCFKTGSFQPLLVNDFSILETDTEYVNILMWWDLVKNGNLERILGMSDAEFTHRLCKLIVRMDNLVSSLTGFDKKIMSDKLLKLKLIKNENITIKISSGTRKAPFAVELFGESSQGKTTFGDLLIDALLTSANLPLDKQYRAALNPGDKFYSNWSSDKLVAILDDLSNEKADFVEKAPTRAVIDFCNNQMFYAPKAELDAKGKCFVEPELVLVTTNKKDLDAHVYSNCPYSVQRRMNLVMTVKCKERFQRFVNVGGTKVPVGVDSSKIREFYTDDNGVYNPPVIDDIWEIDIERAVKPEVLTHVAHYAPVVYEGNEMVRVSASEAIQVAIEHYQEHRCNQETIMNNMRCRSIGMERCNVDGCFHIRGFCPKHMNAQFGLELSKCVLNIKKDCTNYVVGRTSVVERAIEKYATDKLYNLAKSFSQKWDWLCIVPTDWCTHSLFLSFIERLCQDELNKTRNNYYFLAFMCLFISICTRSILSFLLLILAVIFIYAASKNRMRKVLEAELLRRNDSIPIILKGVRDDYAKTICYSCGLVATLYLLSKLYKSFRSSHPSQGNLEPDNCNDILERDNEVNVWSKVVKRDVPVSHKSASVTNCQLSDMIKRNLFYASIHTRDGKLMSNVLFIKTGVLIVPNHYFGDSAMEYVVDCFKDQPHATGGKFTTVINLQNSYMIPNTDIRVCYVSSGGSFKNLIDYFPLSKPSGTQYSDMCWRAKDGNLVLGSADLEYKKTTNGEVIFYGAVYKKMNIDTFQGMCGAVWVANTNKPYIAGFHLGGVAGTPRGCCGVVTKLELENAIQHLRKVDGIVITSSDSEFKPHMFGVKTLINGDLHRKSPLNYLPEGSQFTYYGSCTGASSSYSCVRTTPISEHVERICGVTNIWGPPKFKPEWYGWQKCLANASVPADEFSYVDLKWAMNDYKSALLPLVRKPYWKDMRPLKDQENVNGVPGVRFLDAINMSTSMGYPLTGPKSKYVVNMDSKDENGLYTRKFNDEVMEAIYDAEYNYKIGLRNHFIAKACKKDEALVVSKEKCRVFYGNSIVLTYLIRKYFLPIVRFIGMNPLKAECAVGINCHNKEWDQMYRHVTKYSAVNIIGGDYGKYDQKLPSQLIFSALRILIDLAKECDYSDEDISIMENMCADIVYSYIAFNGDMVGITSGTHISGNSLTVLINSICGSLNMRVCFSKIYGQNLKFRECVSLITYGDDNIGSVKDGFAHFNIKSCADILSLYGQEYTMPDKGSEITPFLRIDQFEFLKRSNVFHNDLNCNIGALSESSIFKSLHCYLRPKKSILTPNEACALNIDGALREWFNHGKDIYEVRREQMNEVAKASGLSTRCNLLDRTYEDCVVLWLSNSFDTLTSVDDDNFVVQSGFEFEDLYLRAQDEIPMAILSMNQVIVHQDFGEIDLIFKRIYDGIPHYLLIEVKHSHCPAIRRKGRAQLRRVSYALHYLMPRAPLIAVLLTPYGYELVEEHGGQGMWHRFNLPFSGMQRS
jgi:hypothetical protein